jgi:hypothetical protein
MKLVLKNFILLLLLVTAMSCSKFRKIQKSTDWKVKYAAALDYYEEKDYFRSNALLEDILPIIRGTEESEKANSYLVPIILSFSQTSTEEVNTWRKQPIWTPIHFISNLHKLV